jgi:sugar phosphate permease
MAVATAGATAADPPEHSAAFRTRRFLNWFPMGLTYAFLYMGRYNLTVAKNALGDLMTKEDFGKIFAAGTVVYALAFLVNGPLTDRIGGKRAIVIAAVGTGVMNLIMGTYLSHVVAAGSADNAELRFWFSLLYAGNMYFQSFGAVAIVKVNAHWFHVRERGGFSGIFGTMISSGLYFAFTVNQLVLDALTAGSVGTTKTLQTKWVFFLPGALLLGMAVIELFLLRDRPSQAGHQDFDTGDASSDETEQAPGALAGIVSALKLIRAIVTHPVILTVAFIEFCTGVLRNGVMHWYPIYVNEVLRLPSDHYLRAGHWSLKFSLPCFALSAVFFLLASRSKGSRKGSFYISGGLLFLAPFLQGGWGGILMVAGVIGGNVAGWISDLLFQSRRAPAAGGLYALLFLSALGMSAVLGRATEVVATTKVDGLREGDRIVSVAGKRDLGDFAHVSRAFACVPAPCVGGAAWDDKTCLCASKGGTAVTLASMKPTIPVEIERAGKTMLVEIADPALKAGKDGVLEPKLRAGDGRVLAASPILSLSPYLLAGVVFLISLSVIGTHGLLSGTATMDFGGRKGAATAVGVIDGFVYLGTALQSVSLGFLTTESWTYWPWFLAPFALIGFTLCLRIWNAKPGKGGH